jgi:hypothetical protein
LLIDLAAMIREHAQMADLRMLIEPMTRENMRNSTVLSTEISAANTKISGGI